MLLYSKRRYVLFIVLNGIEFKHFMKQNYFDFKLREKPPLIPLNMAVTRSPVITIAMKISFRKHVISVTVSWGRFY